MDFGLTPGHSTQLGREERFRTRIFRKGQDYKDVFLGRVKCSCGVFIKERLLHVESVCSGHCVRTRGSQT